MLALAVHPAPVDLTPPRARVERRLLVRAAAPVEVPERDAEALDLVGTLHRDRAYRPMALGLHEGRLWSPILVRGADGVGVPIGRRDFLDFLEGRDGPAAGELLDAFAGTPLVACAGKPAREPFPPRDPARGEPVDVAGSRAVGRDGRPAAAAALAQWVEGSLRLFGGIPHRRRSPLAHLGVPHVGPVRLQVEDWGVPTSYRQVAASIGAWDDALAWLGAIGADPPPSGAEAWLALVPGDAVAGDDVRLAANAYPGPLRTDIDARLLGPGLRPGEAERLQALRDELAEAEWHALVGCAHLHGDEEGIAVVLRGLVELGAPGSGRVGDQGHARLAGFIEGVLRPRLASRAGGDLDALAGLAT